VEKKTKVEAKQVDMPREFLDKGIAMGIGLDQRYPIIVRPNVFKDRLYLSVRKFDSWEEKITYPTRKGIEIPWEQVDAVIEAIRAVVTDLEESGRASPEALNGSDELPF